MFVSKLGITLLNVYSFFCIIPFVCTVHRNYIKVRSSNALLYFIKTVASTSVFGYCQFLICYDKLRTSKALNELVFTICTGIIYLILVFYYAYMFINRGKLQSLFDDIQIIFKRINLVKISKASTEAPLTAIFIVQSCFFILTMTYLLIIYYVNYNWEDFLMYTVGFTIPKLIIIFCTVNFCNYLALVRRNCRFLKLRLKRGDIGTDFAFALYFAIVRSLQKINKFFGYVNLLLLAKFSMWFIYELYHLTIIVMYKGAFLKKYRFLTLYACSWILLLALPILVLIASCVYTRKLVLDVLPMLLVKSIRNGTVKTTTRKLGGRSEMDIEKMWSLRILHHKVVFTCRDWIELDWSLLFTIIQVFVTYIVFLTQFSSEVD